MSVRKLKKTKSMKRGYSVSDPMVQTWWNVVLLLSSVPLAAVWTATDWCYV